MNDFTERLTNRGTDGRSDRRNGRRAECKFEKAVELQENKAVYTTAPVAGGWAGAVMSWAGA